MGKRKTKAKKPTGPKKKEKLPTTFQCLFCNHENSVAVKLEPKAGIGNLLCKVCGQSFQSSINGLSAPVDVYADWVDACDAVAKEDAAAGGPTSTYSRVGLASRPTAGGDEGNIEGDFVVDDDMDAEGDYDD